MKPLLTLVATITTLLFSNSSFSQKDKDIPAWGKVEKAELEMKVYEIDKDAEAVVLFDVGELICDQSYNIQLERRIRIKILKEGGLERADIHLNYIHYQNEENIIKLSAQTYNLDAAGNIVVTPVDKKSFFDKKINKRISERVFTFPEVKVGSIIEYKYIRTGAGLVTWYFQRSIPVKFSRYTTDFPSEVELASIPNCVLPYDTKRDTRSTRHIITHTMTEVPALRDEPFISNEDDYLQRIETRLQAVTNTMGVRTSFTRTWPGIIKQLMEDEDFGIQLKRNIPRTADLEEELRKITDPYEKMKIIHHYVRKNMTWNGYDNIWALDGVKAAWKDKKGTTGEINLILVNLLKDAGLDASPMLVSTHDHGRVMPMAPSFAQFNEVIAYVKIGEKQYYLDATEKNTPTHLIPKNILFTEGLVISKLETFEWGWQSLWNEKLLKKKMVVLRAELNEKDSMVGEVNVSSIDYDRVERSAVLKNDGKEKFRAKYFTEPNANMRIDSLHIDNELNDSLPLVQKFTFSQPISGSGDYKFFNVNLFTGLEKNPFVADNRFSDIFFGTNQTYVIIGNFKIPDGYTYEELPKNMRMIMPDTSIEISRRIASENTVLSVRISLEFKRPYYTVEEYPDFKEFYKKLFDILNEQIVFRKKALPDPKPKP